MKTIAEDIIDFVDRRKDHETDDVSRNITIEMAFDRILRNAYPSDIPEAMQEIQRAGRDDVFRRFAHVMDIRPFDLDTIAMQAVERSAERPSAPRF